MKKFKYLFLLIVAPFVLLSCEEDEPVDVIKPKTDIFLNGDVNFGTLNYPLIGAVALGAGEIPAYFVQVSNGVTQVEVINRYNLPAPNNANTFTKSLGVFDVEDGKAQIPAIPVSQLRNNADPLITGTANAGVNTLLIDAIFADGSRERRVVPLTLNRTYININDDPFKLFLDGDYTSGVESFTVRVSGDVSSVIVTNRYSLPNTTTTTDRVIGTYSVDPVTRLVTIPAADVAFAKLRRQTVVGPPLVPGDPVITGRSDIGLNTFRIEAVFTSGGANQLRPFSILWD
jgi:hypothetical protein